MSERHMVTPSVQIAVYDDSNPPNVLLHKRANTGFKDSQYDLPSGHIEKDEMATEAAARELYEEAGLMADPEDFELFHVMNNEVESPDRPYLYLFCKIALTKCHGQYRIMEPEKCNEIGLFPIDNLPRVTTSHTVAALKHFGSQAVTFSKITL